MTVPAPLPPNESDRLQALRDRGVLDTPAEGDFDHIVEVASAICGTPIALVSLVDADRQWFKARVGLDATETHRDLAFCAHAILDPGDVFVVENAEEDVRFRANPLVTAQPDIRFYAGAPISTADGQALGTVCVIDTKPRSIPAEHRRLLQALAKTAGALFDMRFATAEVERRNRDLLDYQTLLHRHQVELEDANRKLEEQSRTDPLTGLLNRRGLDAVLVREVGRSERHDQPLALVLFDIDKFKPYNDTYGHPAGDVAIATVGALLREVARSSDAVARYGGEEFCVVLPQTDARGAFTIAERLRERVEAFDWPLRPITVSLGIAALPQHGVSPETLLQAADTALYGAKQAGRNCSQVATTTIDIKLSSRRSA